MNIPTFTIFIPTYNRNYTIKRCLSSLSRQTFKDFEVLVIDDGSTDNTIEIVNSFNDLLNIKYFWKENGGKHTAINLGIEKANGEFFLILDSDDFLMDYALELFYKHWDELDNKSEYCGIMMRCREMHKNGIIGNKFPSSPFISNYIDFHFLSGPRNGGYGDCCEIIKTDILKNYRFPDIKSTRFIPESYIMDQIGLHYKLKCFNEIVQIKEYQADGITKNRKNYNKKNYIGYLLNTISKLDDIFPYVKKIPLKIKILYWYDYWNYLNFGNSHIEFRVRKVTILGYMVKFFYPLIKYIRK